MKHCTLVIFGGTGDLTKRKLIPAVYRLICQRKSLPNLHVLAVGRREKTDTAFREEMRASLRADAGMDLTDGQWDCLSPHIGYETLDFAKDRDGFSRLEARIQNLEGASGAEGGDRMYYLAVAPEHFGTIVEHLAHANMLGGEDNGRGFRRVLVEKPFGHSLKDASGLNERLLAHLRETDIFRIDHYLGKEMLQDILAVRFGNAVFEPLWNHRHIDHVRILSHETLGVETRGGYFDHSGILKDMVQNHLLQMLTMIAMEPPIRLDPESIRDEKVKVLRALRPFTPQTVVTDVLRGQYGAGSRTDRSGQTLRMPAYRDEDRVRPDSNTETYVSLKTWVDNVRWGGVPFYLEAGKRMKRKLTTIIIQFKPLSGMQPYEEFGQTACNRLVFEIQPQEGFHFIVNGKRPDADWAMDEVAMEYCQSCRSDNNSPEAYERILLEAWRNNTSLFARWDELYHSWQFIDSIRHNWTDLTPNFPNYPAGTDGPEGTHPEIATLYTDMGTLNTTAITIGAACPLPRD